MQLPFTTEQFYGLFSEYNLTLWPSQVALLVLAIVAIAFIIFPRRWSGVAVSAILALLWAWPGITYHLPFFTTINPLAYGFAVLSFIGALIFLWQGVIRKRLEFRITRSVRTVFGLLLVVFALAIYPAWSVYAGHAYPELPTFGLPCPTTIYTIGLLAFLVRPYPRTPLVVPVVWSFIGGQAAFLLSVPQDLGLVVAGLVGLVLLMRSKGKALT
jgi:hypothetical protein